MNSTNERTICGRIKNIKKLKFECYADIEVGEESIHISFPRLEELPQNYDIVKVILGDVDKSQKLQTVKALDIEILSKCQDRNQLNQDTLDIITMRRDVLNIIDQHLSAIGAIKVETPLMSVYRGTSKVVPFETTTKLGEKRFFKITHDFKLRSLLIDTLKPVYETGKVLRNMGASNRHATEYNMLELHLPYKDLSEGVDLAVDLLTEIASYFGNSDFKEVPKYDIQQIFSINGMNFDEMDNVSRAKAYKDRIKKLKGPIVSSLLDAEQSPLAKICSSSGLALDAELIYQNKGIAHIYEVENDPDLLIERFLEQTDDKSELDLEFINKLKAGSPPSVLVGIGIDRTISAMKGISFQDFMRGVIKH